MLLARRGSSTGQGGVELAVSGHTTFLLATDLRIGGSKVQLDGVEGIPLQLWQLTRSIPFQRTSLDLTSVYFRNLLSFLGDLNRDKRGGGGNLSSPGGMDDVDLDSELQLVTRGPHYRIVAERLTNAVSVAGREYGVGLVLKLHRGQVPTFEIDFANREAVERFLMSLRRCLFQDRLIKVLRTSIHARSAHRDLSVGVQLFLALVGSGSGGGSAYVREVTRENAEYSLAVVRRQMSFSTNHSLPTLLTAIQEQVDEGSALHLCVLCQEFFESDDANTDEESWIMCPTCSGEGLPSPTGISTELPLTKADIEMDRSSPDGPLGRNKLDSSIRDYNLYHDNATYHLQRSQLASRGDDDKVVFEGVLKIFWGMKKAITLLPKPPAPKRPAPSRNGLYGSCMQLSEDQKEPPSLLSSYNPRDFFTQSVDATDLPGGIREEDQLDGEDVLVQSLPSKYLGVTLRKKNPRLMRANFAAKRRSVLYRKVARQQSLEEEVAAAVDKRSKFIPPYGSSTNLRVSSSHTSEDVIKLLMLKFNVENPPSDYVLYVMHDTGHMELLSRTDHPLAVRLKLGPSEDIAKIYITEAEGTEQMKISHEVSEFIKFQLPELCVFAKKFEEEEDREMDRVRSLFKQWREQIQSQLSKIHAQSSSMQI